MAATRVQIPGQFIAVYDDGKITEWVFMPSASYAGYFGPSAVVVDGDEDLEVEATDGPFWRAVQRSLVEDDLVVDWEE